MLVIYCMRFYRKYSPHTDLIYYFSRLGRQNDRILPYMLVLDTVSRMMTHIFSFSKGTFSCSIPVLTDSGDKGSSNAPKFSRRMKSSSSAVEVMTGSQCRGGSQVYPQSLVARCHRLSRKDQHLSRISSAAWHVCCFLFFNNQIIENKDIEPHRVECFDGFFWCSYDWLTVVVK